MGLWERAGDCEMGCVVIGSRWVVIIEWALEER